jgi:hypothetical protein
MEDSNMDKKGIILSDNLITSLYNAIITAQNDETKQFLKDLKELTEDIKQDFIDGKL